MKKYLLMAVGVIMMLVAFTIQSEAQVKRFTNPLGTSAVPIYSDTVSNTATVYITSPAMPSKNPMKAQETIIQVNVTKISGTVGGTISLQGSLDGTNYKALNTAETQTALATITATDATNVYHWRLNGNPFVYYRISWTGTGTMSASFSGYILSH